jgi:hypothetical protein
MNNPKKSKSKEIKFYLAKNTSIIYKEAGKRMQILALVAE